MLFALAIFLILIAICALPAVLDWYDEAKKHRGVAEDKELPATVPSW